VLHTFSYLLWLGLLFFSCSLLRISHWHIFRLGDNFRKFLKYLFRYTVNFLNNRENNRGDNNLFFNLNRGNNFLLDRGDDRDTDRGYNDFFLFLLPLLLLFADCFLQLLTIANSLVCIKTPLSLKLSSAP
jgi:hypothetical protein